jgi:hypothetical protein
MGLFFLSNNCREVFYGLIYHVKNLGGNNKLKLIDYLNVVLCLVAFKHPLLSLEKKPMNETDNTNQY